MTLAKVRIVLVILKTSIRGGALTGSVLKITMDTFISDSTRLFIFAAKVMGELRTQSVASSACANIIEHDATCTHRCRWRRSKRSFQRGRGGRMMMMKRKMKFEGVGVSRWDGMQGRG